MVWELTIVGPWGNAFYVPLETDDIVRTLAEYRARGYRVIRWRLLGPVSA